MASSNVTLAYRNELERAWQLLLEAGVPLAPGKPRIPDLDLNDVAEAVSTLASCNDELAPVEQEALHAWLRAWQHHWPRHFEEYLGPAGESLLRTTEEHARDQNRYLKLRRIAISNLSRLL